MPRPSDPQVRRGRLDVCWDALRLRRRRQVWELEDCAWLPAPIRDGLTDFLRFSASRSGMHRRIAPRLAAALRATGSRQVVDLCSGGGGPWALLQPVLAAAGEPVAVVLTDRFPNPSAARLVPRTTLHATAVDATAVPPGLTGFRTLFSAFHHFDDPAAAAILADAVRHGRGIAIVETTARHPLALLFMVLCPPLVALSAPFIRPWRWSRLFWNLVVPAVPLAVAHDGFMSCLRTRSPAELLELVDAVPGAGAWHWEAGIERIGGLRVGCTWLIGVPAVRS